MPYLVGQSTLMRGSLTGFNWDSSRADCFASRCAVFAVLTSVPYRGKKTGKTRGGTRVEFSRGTAARVEVFVAARVGVESMLSCVFWGGVWRS